MRSSNSVTRCASHACSSTSSIIPQSNLFSPLTTRPIDIIYTLPSPLSGATFLHTVDHQLFCFLTVTAVEHPASLAAYVYSSHST